MARIEEAKDCHSGSHDAEAQRRNSTVPPRPSLQNRIAELTAELERVKMENTVLAAKMTELEASAASSTNSDGTADYTRSHAEEHTQGAGYADQTWAEAQDRAQTIPGVVLRRWDTSESESSTGTASDLPGPGRALNNFVFSPAGRKLEFWLARMAHRLGYGPHAVAARLEVMTRETMTTAGDLNLLRFMHSKFSDGLINLVKYVSSESLPVRIVAMEQISNFLHPPPNNLAGCCMRVKPLFEENHEYPQIIACVSRTAAANMCYKKTDVIYALIKDISCVSHLMTGIPSNWLVSAIYNHLHHKSSQEGASSCTCCASRPLARMPRRHENKREFSCLIHIATFQYRSTQQEAWKLIGYALAMISEKAPRDRRPSLLIENVLRLCADQLYELCQCDLKCYSKHDTCKRRRGRQGKTEPYSSSFSCWIIGEDMIERRKVALYHDTARGEA